MRFDRTGKVSEDFYVIGNAGIPVYLLDGPCPVLFDSGIAALADRYIHDLKEILDHRSPAMLFLTHSHFDHIGSAGHLKAQWPDMEIAASAKTVEVLKKPSALHMIRLLNEESAKVVAQWRGAKIDSLEFKPFTVDRVLEPGQTIGLDPERTVEVIGAPGHTWDFLAFRIPQRKILVASEAVGCPHGDGPVLCEFLVDYDAYRESLVKLTDLDTRVLCPGHQQVMTGEDVPAYLKQSLVELEQYLHQVEIFLTEEDGDLEQVINRVQAWEWDPLNLPKQPEPAYRLNAEARVKTVWERMNRGK